MVYHKPLRGFNFGSIGEGFFSYSLKLCMVNNTFILFNKQCIIKEENVLLKNNNDQILE